MSTTIRKLTSEHKGVRYKAVVRERGTGRVLKARTFSRKSLAEEWADNEDRRREEAVAKGSESYAHTFGELLDLYRRERPVQAEERAGHLAWWEATFGRDTVLATIRTDTVRSALKKYVAGEATMKMRDGRTKLLGRKRSGAAFNRRLAYLSAVYKLGGDEGLIGKDENPCRGVVRMREPPGRERVLSAEEFGRLATAAQASPWTRLYLRVLLAVTAGGRPGEVERLRWQDIAWSAGTATVPPDPETGRRHKTAEHHGEARVLYLTEPVLAELARVLLLSGDAPEDLIFGRQSAPAVKGDSDRPFLYRQYWEEALDKAGIPRTGKDKVTPYNLRHTNVTMLVERLLAGGVEESVVTMVVSKLAGHTNIQTTRRYVHPRAEALRKAVEGTFGNLTAPPEPPALPEPR